MFEELLRTKRRQSSRHTELHKYELKTVFRQDDEEFVRILNNIRVYDPESKRLTSHIVAKFRQYPICLAYALTIHKAQGQTYQSVAIDVNNGAFDTGQTYVALSRCVSLNNLYLITPIRSQDIKVDQEVLNYMEDYDYYGDSNVNVYKPGQKNIFDYDDEE